MKKTLVFVLIAVIGCSSLKNGNKDEPIKLSDEDMSPARLVGDFSAPVGTSPIEIGGFGIVVNLANTGSVEGPSYERTQVYQELQRQNIPNVSELISSKTTTLVRIRAVLGAGTQEGDVLDAEVVCLAGSDAESLRGGYLIPTTLKEIAAIDGSPKQGFPIAKVEGAVLLPLPGSDKPTPMELTRGKILGGVKLLKNRPMGLGIKTEKQSYFISTRMTKVVNDRFFIPESMNKSIATAKRPDYIDLAVHPSYRNNISRYLRIVQSISMFSDAAQRIDRINQLETELLDPKTAQHASYQLEAIGKQAIPALRKGLQSQNTEIRFYSAVSLAYLNCVDAAAPLAEIARKEAAFRVFALEALGTMKNDFEAESQLGMLLDESSVETRYGAFRALWHRNPNDVKIRGETLGNQFAYHVIDTKGPHLVHIAITRRAEIVLFGNNIEMPPNYMLEAGPRIIVKSSRSGETVIKKIDVHLDDSRTVSSRLDEIIRAIVELGGGYADIIDFLRDASRQKLLPCRLEIDKIPQSGRIYTPAFSEEDFFVQTEEKPAKKSFWSKANPKNWKSADENEDDE